MILGVPSASAGCSPVMGPQPMTPRQLSRLFHEAAETAGITKPGQPARASPQLRDAPARSRYRYPNDPGAAGTYQIGDDGALHARRHRPDPSIESPLDRLTQPRKRAKKTGNGRPPAKYRRRMPRPALEVADIFRDHGAAWRFANGGHVSFGQMKVMSAIERCRTAALGGHVARCENDAAAIRSSAYNSCRDRHCPRCQGAASRKWLAEPRGRVAAR